MSKQGQNGKLSYQEISKLKIQTYDKGGVISKTKSSPLDTIAKSLGEDVIVSAKDGERILTPVQNQMWEKWTEALPHLQNLSDIIKVNVPDYSYFNNVVPKNNVQPTVSV